MAKAIIIQEGNEVCNNALSSKMFVDELLKEGVALRMTLETREEFIEATKRADIVSIGHKDCAQEVGVKPKRLTVHLEPNDTLHIIEANQEGGTRLDIGVTELSQMKGLFFRFIKLEVFEPVVIEKGLEELERIGHEIESWERVEMEGL